MTIVCGTDFSEPAEHAVHAAADLAARMGVPLHLVHSVELNTAPLLEERRGAVADWALRQLERLAERARSAGARVEIHVQGGPPDETLLAVAKLVSAQLIVVAALGQRRPGKWQMGSHADRLAHDSHVPVLVVRDAELFAAWTRQSRPLRILLGADLSQSSEGALAWINELRRFGPCDVVATHLYWAPEVFHRLGLTGVRDYLEPDPEVQATLVRAFSKRMQSVLSPVRLRVEPHLGRLGDRLAALAVEEHADMVVVGSHDRSLAARVLHGSVSHELVKGARLSVVCVPAQPLEVSPRFDSVLVATDLGPVGNAAIRLANAAVGPFGTVHLVHVVPARSSDNVQAQDIFAGPGEVPSEAEAAASRQLAELLPQVVSDYGPSTRLHVLRSNDAAEAICQAAERLDVSLLCLGTHGRTGLSKALLGSIAASVVGTTTRPVLLARPPRE